MSRKARTRAFAAALLLLAAGGALAVGRVSGTFAIFTSETVNQNAVAQGSWIPAPSGTSSTLPGASPYGTIGLGWTSGASAATPSPNPVTGQAISYADGGSGASASCGSYSTLSTVGAGATSATVTGPNLADWWCFSVQSTSAGPWTSAPVAFTPLRILVPVSVVVANGGSGTNRMNRNDTITITFNQAINTPAANRFCGVNNGGNDVILLGDTRGFGTCQASDAYTIGKITGVTVSSSTTAMTETATVSGSVLTVTITQNSTRTATFGAPVFVAASGDTAVTGGEPACISASAPNCTVGAGGGF